MLRKLEKKIYKSLKWWLVIKNSGVRKIIRINKEIYGWINFSEQYKFKRNQIFKRIIKIRNTWSIIFV